MSSHTSTTISTRRRLPTRWRSAPSGPEPGRPAADRAPRLSIRLAVTIAPHRPDAWPARPHAGPAEQRHQGGYQQRPGHHRVDHNAGGHRDRDFTELLQRDDREESEARGEGDAGDRDRARRLRTGDGDRVPQRAAPGFLPDPSD